MVWKAANIFPNKNQSKKHVQLFDSSPCLFLDLVFCSCAGLAPFSGDVFLQTIILAVRRPQTYFLGKNMKQNKYLLGRAFCLRPKQIEKTQTIKICQTK